MDSLHRDHEIPQVRSDRVRDFVRAIGRSQALDILDFIGRDPTAFRSLERGLGLASNILASRLKELVSVGLLVRETRPGTRRYAYTLTPLAWALRGFLVEIERGLGGEPSQIHGSGPTRVD